MPKPKPDFPSHAEIRALADPAGKIAVRVIPGARQEVLEIQDNRLFVKVRAKPEEGKATAAVLDLLAAALGMATSQIRLLRGATSREKLFEIEF